MPGPAISKGSDHFFNVLYEGNGGGQRVGKFIPFTDNGTIDKSCIFNDGDEPELSRTPSGAGNRDTFTLSFWIKRCTIGSLQLIFQQGADVNNCTQLSFDSNDRFQYQQVDGGSNTDSLISNRTFEDTSKFYHFVLAVDTTQATEANRVRMYVDGDEITSWNTANYPSQNTDTDMNTTTEFSIGRQLGATSAYSPDCYLAEVNYVDGTQYTPSTFGLTDTSTGRWIPKSLTGISYGTNGFRLEFANSAGQTIGDDTSGNGNDFTVSNINPVTDLTTDSPTQNFATGFHNQDDNGTLTMSEGNLRAAQGSGTSKMSTMRSTLTLDPKDPNLYYCEGKVITEQGGNGVTFGITDVKADGVRMSSSTLKFGVGSNYMFACDTYVVREFNGTDVGTGNDATLNPEFTDGDYIGIAFQKGRIWIAKNNTWSNSGNPANGTGYLFEVPNDSLYRFVSGQYGPSGGCISEFNFGQKAFNYTPPTGAKKLVQDNLPSATRDFADFVWTKNRSSTSYNHVLYDSSRGVHKYINSNTTGTEGTDSDGLTKFLNGGFATEDAGYTNTNADSYVSWIWHANGGTTTANTDGSGATIASTIQANQTAGFSIVKTVGTGSAGTIAHGLGKAPEWIIGKNLDTSGNWVVYHKIFGADQIIYLNLNNNKASSSDYWGTTEPTANVFGVKAGGVDINTNTNETIFYCWTSIPGYSKFGTYTGGGGTDGTFTYLGFKPAWLLVKRYGSSGNWYLLDSARGPINDSDGGGKTLMPNHVNADQVQTRIDLLSNGFKQRISNDGSNLNSATYIYMAFAEHPFIGDGTNPTTAR